MKTIEIAGRKIGAGQPVYVIAELSANHGQNFDEAVRIIRAAKECGADAVKLQTYTPDTLTIDCANDYFCIGKGTIWQGRRLYDLYAEAYTPWDWQPKLKQIAEEIGLHCFSTPFDASAVQFLEQMYVPAYKVASFELIDSPLLEQIARTGKPVIMSTGMASLAEISEAVACLRTHGAGEIALLKCTSAYPALPEDMNLRTLADLAERFAVPVGLSDHTLDIAVPVASVALGASILEKHLTLDRRVPGPDSAFSLEPHEFKATVDAIRVVENALGQVVYAPTAQEMQSRMFRRSLFVIRDMRAGEEFTNENVRSIRPGHGLPPKFLPGLIGRRATVAIERGSPLTWELVDGINAAKAS